MRRVACGVMLLVTAGAMAAGAQAPSRTVWVQTTVTDSQGQLVRALGPSDFRVIASDEPRPVTMVSKNELPMALSLMMDVSGSMRKQQFKVRRSAELLLSEFGRGDRVNVGAFEAKVAVTNRFTANRDRILRSLEQPATGADTQCEPPSPVQTTSMTAPVGGGGTALWDAVWCGVRELQRDTEAIRKVLIVISDGLDNRSRIGQADAVRFAQAAGVLVYTVGFYGIENDPRGQRSDRRLRELAVKNGGRYFPIEESQPLEPVFRAIGDELRAHYVIGFEPRNPRSAGTLLVEVTTPGLTARARERYSANGR